MHASWCGLLLVLSASSAARASFFTHLSPKFSHNAKLSAFWEGLLAVSSGVMEEDGANCVLPVSVYRETRSSWVQPSWAKAYDVRLAVVSSVNASCPNSTRPAASLMLANASLFYYECPSGSGSCGIIPLMLWDNGTATQGAWFSVADCGQGAIEGVVGRAGKPGSILGISGACLALDVSNGTAMHPATLALPYRFVSVSPEEDVIVSFDGSHRVATMSRPENSSWSLSCNQSFVGPVSSVALWEDKLYAGNPLHNQSSALMTGEITIYSQNTSCWSTLGTIEPDESLKLSNVQLGRDIRVGHGGLLVSLGDRQLFYMSIPGQGSAHVVNDLFGDETGPAVLLGVQLKNGHPAVSWASSTKAHVAYPLGTGIDKQMELIVLLICAAALLVVVVVFFVVVVVQKRRRETEYEQLPPENPSALRK